MSKWLADPNKAKPGGKHGNFDFGTVIEDQITGANRGERVPGDNKMDSIDYGIDDWGKGWNPDGSKSFNKQFWCVACANDPLK